LLVGHLLLLHSQCRAEPDSRLKKFPIAAGALKVPISRQAARTLFFVIEKIFAATQRILTQEFAVTSPPISGKKRLEHLVY
jgi:hypothetical protein